MSRSQHFIKQLQKAIGYQFSDESLLRLALKHKSSGKPNNERLEFLGDAILGAVVAESLYRNDDIAEEGVMTVVRSRLVNGDALSDLGLTLGIDKLLDLGRGERGEGDVKRSIVEDAVEAVVGAIFLDSSFEIVRAVLLELLQERVIALSQQTFTKDPKSELQELMQANAVDLPTYSLVSMEGPEHQREFTVSCEVSLCRDLTQATGASRKQAERLAAKAMLEKLKSNER